VASSVAARIEDDLRGLVEGDVLFDEISRTLYSTDASIFRVRPLGVVCPKHEGDVLHLVRYASEQGISLTARGAGTGMAGESLGTGLVVDFSRYMNRILRVGEETVVAQPGAVFQEVQRHLRPLGRRLAPDPASGAACTLGGMVATNASGSRSLKYGYTRDYVERVRCVLADGTLWDVGQVPWRVGTAASSGRRPEDLAGRLALLIQQHRALIERYQKHLGLHNRCPYLLHDVVQDDSVHLARLLCGTEGTLALLTGVTLRTVPIPKARAVALLLFDRLEAALESVAEILSYGPSACDLLDRRLLHLACTAEPRYSRMVPDEAEAALVVEQEGDDELEVYHRMRLTVNRLRRVKRLATVAHEAYEADERRFLWAIRTAAVRQLSRLPGDLRPIPYVEDIAVPPGSLREFLSAALRLLRQKNLVATLYAHAGHGQLHLRPFLDLSRLDHQQQLQELAEELYTICAQLGGSVSGEHGVGIARSAFVRRQYGELVEVFRQLRALFDPREQLNPGKITSSVPFSAPALRSSRATADLKSLPVLGPSVASWENIARQCHGCALCRTREVPLRMCPIFRADPSEHATPRAKANVIRGLLSGELAPSVCASEEFKKLAHLCVNCRMCRMECPAEVDVPRLMLDAKAVYVAQNGLTASEWFLSRIERWVRFSSSIAPLANLALKSRLCRFLLEKCFGLAASRPLPSIHLRTLFRRARRKRWTDRPRGATGLKAAYFVDLYANYLDPELGETVVQVLQAHGASVYIPPQQLPSGMPLLNYGDVEQATAVAQRNVGLLAELVREGYEIVCSEPTAALMLREEYPRLMPSPDAQLVADHTMELGQYLAQVRRVHGGPPLASVDLAVGYHAPCHLLALQRGLAFRDLLLQIPGLKLRTFEEGCSGMAGTYGLMKRHLQSSLAAGHRLLEAIATSPLELVASECCTCRMQIEYGASMTTAHPVELVAQSLGLSHRVAQRVVRSPRRLE
jgi:FAD/FMN-containing dehydrogenase/Fe-S oxidoreductase